mgnify:FL=1
MDCRDSALFTGVDEASCENMLRCFSAYEQRFSAGQTILTCGEQQDMIGVLLSGSAALLRLHADGNRTVLESMDEGSVFGEELAFTGFRDGSALIECREDCRVIFMRYDQITKRCENACACHSQVVTNLFQLLSKKSLHLSRRIEVLACEDTILRRGSPDTEDIKYGFEGGRVVKIGNTYHMITSEMVGDPYCVRMRTGYWTSENGTDWRRRATIRESDADFTGASQRAAIWGR